MQTTTNTNKFVFFNADNASVKMTIDHKFAGSADTVEGLVELLLRANVTARDTIMHSSDIDFASEEGFATDDCAHDLISSALETAGIV
jgi:hypothetical protein